MNKLEFFETKVIKVKKEKDKCEHQIHNIDYAFRCPKCGEVFTPHKGGEGNWVNGENLDKIKFPCFCKWNDNVGMIIYDFWDVPMFTLIKIDKQTERNHTYAHLKSLKELIEKYNIHILKGKVIIFDFEKESK